jgi:predicted ATP-grasp superfamily ATP-dependent carboligase
MGILVGVEDWEIFLKTYDKKLTFELAEELSIPYPKTYSPSSFVNLLKTVKNMSFPVVIKPRSKSFWDENGSLHISKITRDNYVHSKKELIEKYKSFIERNESFIHYLPLIQEFIKGKIYDTVLLANKGKILTYFQNIRLRTFPKAGGAYTLAKGIDKEEKMLNSTRKLIKSLNWTGPVMVEFIKSDEDDKFYLIEINGRYWGSLPLTIQCGVDIPWLHFLLLRNKIPFPHIIKYRTDIILQWLLPGDLLWLLENLKDKNFKAIFPFISSLLKSRKAIISKSDCLPTFGGIFFCLILFKEILKGTRSFEGEKI